MASFSTAAINAGLDARVSGTLYLSAHTSFSASGGNEVSGGSPAYARQQIEFSTAASGVVSNSGAETINVPPSTTVAYVGLFDAVTGGNVVGVFPLGSTVTKVGSALAVSEASAQADTFFVPTHGFASGDTVAFFSIGGTVPGGLTEGTGYFISGTPTTNTFQISTEAAGSVLNVVGSGAFIVSNIVAETFGTQGTLELAAGALDLVGLA